MDKQDLLQQLRSQIEQTAEGALAASVEASQDARTAIDPTDRSTDPKNAVELSRMAQGQQQRRERALAELSALRAFVPRPLDERAAVRVGALVEIEDEESGEGRTFFLAPAGAGATLLGPGGDGHVTVVTPHSPIGRAVNGLHVGDVVDVTVKGDVREWAIVWVG